MRASNPGGLALLDGSATGITSLGHCGCDRPHVGTLFRFGKQRVDLYPKEQVVVDAKRLLARPRSMLAASGVCCRPLSAFWRRLQIRHVLSSLL